MLGDFVTVPILYQHGKARIQSDKQTYAVVKLKITHLIWKGDFNSSDCCIWKLILSNNDNLLLVLAKIQMYILLLL